MANEPPESARARRDLGADSFDGGQHRLALSGRPRSVSMAGSKHAIASGPRSRTISATRARPSVTVRLFRLAEASELVERVAHGVSLPQCSFLSPGE